MVGRDSSHQVLSYQTDATVPVTFAQEPALFGAPSKPLLFGARAVCAHAPVASVASRTSPTTETHREMAPCGPRRVAEGAFDGGGARFESIVEGMSNPGVDCLRTQVAARESSRSIHGLQVARMNNS